VKIGEDITAFALKESFRWVLTAISGIWGWIRSKVAGWFRKRRLSKDEERERLRELHALLGDFGQDFPLFLDLAGRGADLVDSKRPSDRKMVAALADGIQVIARGLPPLPRFISDNYLLLPESIRPLLTELREMSTTAFIFSVSVGEIDAESAGTRFHKISRELMEMIERDYF